MIYVHIPFCGSFCNYCDFYSEIFSGQDAGAFIKALAAEAGSREVELAGKPDTLYIGGGTPSVLPLPALCSIVDALKPARMSAGGCFSEFTLEVNPEDVVRKGREYLEGISSLGVNRVSMGVQSFDDGMLRWMNRRHDSSTALKAYDMIRGAGIGNVSIDLIFGISHLGDDMWRKTLDMALSLRPQHISAYQLSIEPGSSLALMVKVGKYREATEQQSRNQYDTLCRKLAEEGYIHYEISNFALPGYEAEHNGAYWRHVPYAGLGPGAHSLRIEGAGCGGERKYIRSWNIPDVRKYVSSFLSGCQETGGSGHRTALPSRMEILTMEQVSIERIMLGLRTSRGVEKSYLEAYSDRARLDVMISEGFLVPASDPSFLRIPERHFFISDSIIADIV